MNHPKKNKIHNPTLPEDQQVDERNLIDLADSEDISIEERISMYWMENKGFIIGCIITLALVIVGFNAMGMYKDHVHAKIQQAYSTALADETLEDFAKANNTHPLGGLAALTLADEAYAAQDFAKALEFYTLAVDALSDNILVGRAALGQAFTLYHSGDEEAGLKALSAITANNTLPESARAEAAYHLAIEADVAGRSAEFESYSAQVNSFSLAETWQQRLGYYQATK